MSAQRSKGTAFETAVVRYLQDHGFPHTERRVSHGVNDRGDITGLPGWVIECKNTRRIDLGEFMGEAECEARNAGCTDHALIVKRRQRNVADAYAVVPLRLFAAMLNTYEERPFTVNGES